MADYVVTTLEASGVNSVAFSPDQSRIYVARSNGTLEVFDTASKAKIATWTVGTNLGGISISEDGSFLLAVERSIGATPPQNSVLYRIATASGSVTTYTQPGSAYVDVEIVDNDTALVSGGQTKLYQLDLTTGIFKDATNGAYYSNSSVMVEDDHLTLLAEYGISNGPLALYDDRTDTIVARGDNYQAGASSGFNFGHTAVSEAGGLVAQFSYYGGINIYDLNLHFLRWMSISGPVDGLAFDASGQFLFARLNSGPLVQY